MSDRHCNSSRRSLRSLFINLQPSIQIGQHPASGMLRGK
ncbi:hypothetical protein NSP_30980 [Nodularia spumigena CCY9414]|nr:hypothetical protein NSP_30980 [Nodularia spumigena CCY9414]